MVFIETPTFRRQAHELLPEHELRNIQSLLIVSPNAGDVIKDTGGLRKLRWKGSGRGKSGGIRIIYYYHVSTSRVFLMFVYPKAVQDDLTPRQTREIRKMIKEIV